MPNEFDSRLKDLQLPETCAEQVAKLISKAGKEFRFCLPFKGECQDFKWFTKWFGNPK